VLFRSGQVEAIVEERDCDDKQRAITEVNPSYYCFDSKLLFETMDKVKPARESGEFYVTDALRLLHSEKRTVSADLRVPAEEATGINTRLDLAHVGRIMEDRIQLRLFGDGVTIVDPDNTWIEADVTIGRDTIIYPFSFIGHGATLGEGCRVGPYGHVGVGDVIPDGVQVLGTTSNSSAVAQSVVNEVEERMPRKKRSTDGSDSAKTATPNGVTTP